MTDINFFKNRIIIDGHADTKQECETITLLCDNLAKSKDFKTVRYESGYAEFEKVGQTVDLKFAAAKGYVTFVFDSTVVSVTNSYGTITTSGESLMTADTIEESLTFVVALQDGYEIDNAILVADEGLGQLKSYSSNTIYCEAGYGGLSGTITISTKQTGSSDNLTWVINEEPTIEPLELNESTTSYNASFTSTRAPFENIGLSNDIGPGKPKNLAQVVFNHGLSSRIAVYASGKWENEAYRTITFLNPVTDSNLLAWLQANATQAQDPAMNVEITNAYGVRLNTAEKYCEEDIIVTPKLQNKEVTSNGVVAADDGYAGLNSVSVNVSGGGVGTYTNDTPTPAALGGIPKGETFSSVSFSDMFTKLLYPYIGPTVTARSTPNGGVFEKGGSQTVTAIAAIIAKGTAAITKVEALDDSTVLGEKTSTDFGSSTVTISVSQTVTTNKSFTARVTDSENKTYTANTAPFSFVYPYYYGVAGISVTINEALIKSLTKSIKSKGTQTVSYTASDQRMIFASPYAVSKITDPNGFDVTTTFTMTRVSVTGLDETAQSYYVYAANEASTVSAFSVTFTIN